MILHELDDHTLTPSCGVLRFGCERDARAQGCGSPSTCRSSSACIHTMSMSKLQTGIENCPLYRPPFGARRTSRPRRCLTYYSLVREAQFLLSCAGFWRPGAPGFTKYAAQYLAGLSPTPGRCSPAQPLTDRRLLHLRTHDSGCPAVQLPATSLWARMVPQVGGAVEGLQQHPRHVCVSPAGRKSLAAQSTIHHFTVNSDSQDPSPRVSVRLSWDKSIFHHEKPPTLGRPHQRLCRVLVAMGPKRGSAKLEVLLQCASGRRTHVRRNSSRTAMT